MHRLIWIFAGLTCRKVHFLTLRLKTWLYAKSVYQFSGPSIEILFSWSNLAWYPIYWQYPASILYKSIAGRDRPDSVADGPIMARYRFIKNASWVCTLCPIVLKLCRCFSHGLKMCMWFGYNHKISFNRFFLVVFQAQTLSKCIGSGYLVSAIPSTVIGCLKLYTCFCHGLKMCMWVGYNPPINFITFSAFWT